MYLSHFGLHEKPFKISTDPRFLWLGEKHREALATLRYGIRYNDGYVVVTGDVGTGKTTLAGALLSELGEEVIAVKVPFPDFDSLDFFKLISTAYGIGNGFQTKGSFFTLFGSFLRSSSAAGKKVVLIIDEAQKLSSDHLKELLHLSNIEENGARLLNIVFVGQNEFNDILLEESHRALRQRITINYNLGALTQEETGQYIAHRLLVAQGKEEIFPPAAVEEIFLFSGGIPRLINIVCDLALLTTYLKGEKIVRPETVKDCAQRLRLPSEKTAGRGNGVHLAARREGAFQIEIEGKDREEGKAEGESEGGRKRFGVKAALGAGFVFLILMAGSFFLFSKPEAPRQEAKSPEATPEGGPENRPAQKTREDAGVKSVPDLAPSAPKEPRTAAETGQGTGAISHPPEEKMTAATKIKKEPGAQTGKVKNHETVGSKATAVRQAAPDSRQGKRENPEKEKVLEAREKAGSGERREGTSPSPALAPGPSGQESSRQGAAGEEVDPNKVIEWLMERRFEKR